MLSAMAADLVFARDDYILISFKCEMEIKSLVLMVARGSLWVMAVAAMMASGTLALYFDLI